MQITTDAIVLKEHPVDEESRIVTLLTKDRGVLYAYIRGAKRLRSKLTTSTQPLCYSHFVLFQNRNRYAVDSADVNASFFDLAADIEKFTLATYLSQLTIEVAPEGEDTADYLRLLLNCLYMLKEDKRGVHFIKPLYELRLLSMAGYMPDLIACRECGAYEKEEMFFLPESGGLCCRDCAGQTGGERLVLLDRSLLFSMRHILYSPMEKLFLFSMSEPGLRRLSKVTETYVKTQLGKTFSALEMFSSLFPEQ